MFEDSAVRGWIKFVKRRVVKWGRAPLILCGRRSRNSMVLTKAGRDGPVLLLQPTGIELSGIRTTIYVDGRRKLLVK